ncbi:MULTISPECIES: hypothetical protein [Bacillales]|uniref:Uncharacterized protein n=1 Tax=Anoxybacillus andreesenii TaxID=1325932 RepID=A0ABT9VAJ0_9BACL|nr:hypothetical protein [Robertmurraya andreesenii]MDQ0157949.1 hypothetical protein [Robertmurraya andreesenii]
MGAKGNKEGINLVIPTVEETKRSDLISLLAYLIKNQATKKRGENE